MATVLADESPIQMRRHGPELNAEHAIGTTDHCLGHGNS